MTSISNISLYISISLYIYKYISISLYIYISFYLYIYKYIYIIISISLIFYLVLHMVMMTYLLTSFLCALTGAWSFEAEHLLPDGLCQRGVACAEGDSTHACPARLRCCWDQGVMNSSQKSCLFHGSLW